MNKRSFLDLCNTHLTRETREALELDGMRTANGDKSLRWVASTPYGWFVYADEEPSEENFPADLIACMVQARKEGCDYILFDTDAEEHDELPTYDEDTGEMIPVEKAA